jgi:nitrogen fixation protein NifB
MIDVSKHPCFNKDSKHRFGRVHLPVAPACNVQCNFCNRKYDCMNESRPGVTSSVLTPGQAMRYLKIALQHDPDLAVVGIAGPGDPFANPEATMETLRRVRAEYPEMLLCVASNGLNIAPHIEDLAELQVSHITLTINAIDSDIAGRVYAWIRDGKKVLRGRDAGERMIRRQFEAVEAIKKHDILLKVNTIVMPGINDKHVPAVAEAVKAAGADILNCMALCHVPDTPFATIEPPTEEQMIALREQVGAILPQMTHCTRCRADAAGKLGCGMAAELLQALRQCAAGPIEPEQKRPYVAVASLEGMIVNQHLGEANSLWVFGPHGEKDCFKLIETRDAPPAGGGAKRWEALAETLRDCRTLLCSGAGDNPRAVLHEHGLRVVVMEGLIEDALRAIYSGADIRSPLRKHTCGSGCAGDGTGCG